MMHGTIKLKFTFTFTLTSVFEVRRSSF